MPTGVTTASDALAITAHATGRPADEQHVIELITTLSAQTDDRWQLALVARSSVQCDRWQELVDAQPDWIRARAGVLQRPRWRRAAAPPADLQLRVDDVPLAHLVETVLAAGKDIRLRIAVQDAYPVRWPSGKDGWSLIGPPVPSESDAPMVGAGTKKSADVVLLRRRWVRRSQP